METVTRPKSVTDLRSFSSSTILSTTCRIFTVSIPLFSIISPILAASLSNNSLSIRLSISFLYCFSSISNSNGASMPSQSLYPASKSPCAIIAPFKAPIDVPVTPPNSYPSSSKAFTAPIWKAPFTPPPSNARPNISMPPFLKLSPFSPDIPYIYYITSVI